jgi:WD40 repeat protein
VHRGRTGNRHHLRVGLNSPRPAGAELRGKQRHQEENSMDTSLRALIRIFLGLKSAYAVRVRSPRGLGWCFIAALCLLPSAVYAAPDSGEIIKLIEQLGNDELAKRQEASKRLEEIGEPALEALHKATKESADPDVRLRAAVVARAIERGNSGEVRKFEGTRGWVYRVVLTPDGKQAVSCGGDAIRVWDLATGKQVRTFGDGQSGWALAVSRDGRRLLCSGPDRVVRLWDLASGKELRQLPGHTNEVWGAAFLADDKQAVTGGFDNTLRVWDLDSGKELRRFEGVNDQVRCLTVSPDGKYVTAGHHLVNNNSTGTIRLWDVATGKEVRAFKGHTGWVTWVVFSPDGKQLLSSSFDKTIRLWDVGTGKELKRFDDQEAGVDGIAFTPDGKRFVSVGMEGDPTVRLWDLASGKELCRLEGHTEPAINVVVTRDGKQALSAGKDGTLRLWQLPK